MPVAKTKKKMRKKKFVAELHLTYNFTYDPESDRFKEALAGYIEAIDRTANEQRMMVQVAWHIRKFGSSAMIEGVGYVSVNGIIKGQPYSGIDLKDEDPEPDIDIISNDYV